MALYSCQSRFFYYAPFFWLVIGVIGNTTLCSFWFKSRMANLGQ
nr:MAG TPA: hypothetical protein [Caudoviricetes sp.]